MYFAEWIWQWCVGGGLGSADRHRQRWWADVFDNGQWYVCLLSAIQRQQRVRRQHRGTGSLEWEAHADRCVYTIQPGTLIERRSGSRIRWDSDGARSAGSESSHSDASRKRGTHSGPESRSPWW